MKIGVDLVRPHVLGGHCQEVATLGLWECVREMKRLHQWRIVQMRAPKSNAAVQDSGFEIARQNLRTWKRTIHQSLKCRMQCILQEVVSGILRQPVQILSLKQDLACIATG